VADVRQLLEIAVTATQVSANEANQVGAYGSRTTIEWATRSIVTSRGWKLIRLPPHP
jgi:hypothetical protein